MKLLFVVLTLLCSILSIEASSISSITPSQDTVPYKKWAFGVHSGYAVNQTGFNLAMSEYGLSLERRFSSCLAFEMELFNLNTTVRRPWSEDSNFSQINLSFGAKYYFGEKKRWYTKLGVTEALTNRNPHGLNRFNFDLNHAMGYNLRMLKNQELKLEINTTFNNVIGVRSGLKLGLRF